MMGISPIKAAYRSPHLQSELVTDHLHFKERAGRTHGPVCSRCCQAVAIIFQNQAAGLSLPQTPLRERHDIIPSHIALSPPDFAHFFSKQIQFPHARRKAKSRSIFSRNALAMLIPRRRFRPHPARRRRRQNKRRHPADNAPPSDQYFAGRIRKSRRARADVI